jgi:hypothetical protein
MSTLRTILALAAVLALTQTVQAQQGYPVRFDLGTTPTPQDLAELFAIPPDGRGLPPGKGTYAQGEKVYADSCAVCHGDKLQGNPTAGIGGDKLIGGRGTLASAAPVKTVESYWPYATTLFDYIKRSMPFITPGSLTDEQCIASSPIFSAKPMSCRRTPCSMQRVSRTSKCPIAMASCPTRGRRSSSTVETVASHGAETRRASEQMVAQSLTAGCGSRPIRRGASA